jgi:hypothetical protein
MFKLGLSYNKLIMSAHRLLAKDRIEISSTQFIAELGEDYTMEVKQYCDPVAQFDEGKPVYILSANCISEDYSHVLSW